VQALVHGRAVATTGRNMVRCTRRSERFIIDLIVMDKSASFDVIWDNAAHYLLFDEDKVSTIQEMQQDHDLSKALCPGLSRFGYHLVEL
jgi:hypothetical protein